MQKMGLEPTRYCYHRHLKPARLPIPPLLHVELTKAILTFFSRVVNHNFEIFLKIFFTNFSLTFRFTFVTIIRSSDKCGSVGTGRRARLRILWLLQSCGFKSHLPHSLKKKLQALPEASFLIRQTSHLKPMASCSRLPARSVRTPRSPGPRSPHLPHSLKKKLQALPEASFLIRQTSHLKPMASCSRLPARSVRTPRSPGPRSPHLPHSLKKKLQALPEASFLIRQTSHLKPMASCSRLPARSVRTPRSPRPRSPHLPHYF